MNLMLIGASGFLGTNLAIALAKDSRNKLTVVDKKMDYFAPLRKQNYSNITYAISDFTISSNYERLFAGQNVVFHLMSTTVPTTSNQQIADELLSNVVVTAKMLEACVSCGVERVVFLSSGGTVYGKEAGCPLGEDTHTNPISSYGLQKITIEKLLFIYWHMFGLDYRIIRLSNPYGPYQRPNGVLGAVTTFTYKALRGEEIVVYGDGSVVRDFIYVDDAIRGILNVTNGTDEHRVFNLGCGYGTSIADVLKTIGSVLKVDMNIIHVPARKVDVPTNYLDIGRYERVYGKLNPITLEEGIRKTADFMIQTKMV